MGSFDSIRTMKLILIFLLAIPAVCCSSNSNVTEIANYRKGQMAHWLATEITHGAFLYFKWSIFARITRCVVESVMRIVSLSRLGEYHLIMSLLYKKLHFLITYWFNHLPHELLQLILQC